MALKTDLLGLIDQRVISLTRLLVQSHFRTSFRVEFQGVARLLSTSKWWCNKCTFSTRLNILTFDGQFCFAPITTNKSKLWKSHLGNYTDVCRGSIAADYGVLIGVAGVTYLVTSRRMSKAIASVVAVSLLVASTTMVTPVAR